MSKSPTLARPYAQAVFELACADGTAAFWSDALGLMAAVVVVPEMASAIGDPKVGRDVVLGAFFELGGSRFDTRAQNLLRVLWDNRKLALLPLIAERYEILRSDAERRTVAQVVSAYPLTLEQQAELSKRLEATLGRAVRLECAVDQRLIGGAVICIADRVIDCSIVGRLGRLARELI